MSHDELASSVVNDITDDDCSQRHVEYARRKVAAALKEASVQALIKAAKAVEAVEFVPPHPSLVTCRDRFVALILRIIEEP